MEYVKLALIYVGIFQFWYFMSIMYYHRHLAHRSVKFSPMLVNIVKTMRWLSQWRSYELNYDRRWAATHIVHHANSDNAETDPYMINIIQTPFTGIPGVPDEVMWKVTKNNSHITTTKLDHFFNKFSRVGFFITATVATLVFGWTGIILAFMLSYSIGPVTSAFNYIAHRWPGHINTVKPKDHARNVLYVWPIYLGEEIHGNHHVWPNRANFGVRWWEVDVGYYFLKLLSCFKLVEILGETHTLPKDKISLQYVPTGEIKDVK